MPATVGVIGLGTIGGSLARALKAIEPAPVVRAHARDLNDMEAARLAGAMDEGFLDVVGVAADVDVLLVATPVGSVSAVLREAVTTLPATALVLDVGSLQAPALEAAAGAGLLDRFVACHPMSGSEASGFHASRADLFDQTRVWLSSAPEVPEALRQLAQTFWAGLGGLPAWIEPDVHDDRMAMVSHLPQALACVLARVLDGGGFTPDDLGPGGRDMTRLAASAPGLWRDLFAHSGPRVAALLRDVAGEIEGWAELLQAGDLDELEARMERTRRWRSP
jgi:prephenate dehydrogenase